MTVQNSTYRSDYTGNGVTVAFAVPFYFLDATHLEVLLTNTATGVVTTLVLNSDYTVTGAGVTAGGTLTMPVAPTASQKLSILRNVPFTQLTHYVPNDPFPADSHERALDLLTMQNQQQEEKLSRSIVLPPESLGPGDTPAPIEGTVLGWAAGKWAWLASATTTLAASLLDTSIMAGDALITVLQPFTGAVSRTLHDWILDYVSIKDFGARTTNTGAQNVTAIQAAFDWLHAQGGGKIFVPPGTYSLNAALTGYPQITVFGAGKLSHLDFTHNGDGIKTTSTLNSTNAFDFALVDLQITCSGASPAGAGYVDVAGSYIYVDRVYFNNWKFGMIADQTEHLHVMRSHFVCGGGVGVFGAGIWLANGNYTGGANTGFTNRITIDQNQFNCQTGALAGIIDDGGSDHTFTNNNHQAGGIRAAGVVALVVTGNEIEGASDVGDLMLTNTSSTGSVVGDCFAIDVRGNLMIGVPGPGYNIALRNACDGSIVDNFFGQSAACINMIGGASNTARAITISNNSKLVSGTYRTAGPFLSSTSANLKRINVKQTACTYAAAAQVGTGAITVTPASMEFVTVGTSLFCINDDGTNGEQIIVTAADATTFTATFASTKTANYIINGLVQSDQQVVAFTPTIEGTTGTIGAGGTYTTQIGRCQRIGNMAYVTVALTWSAVGSWTGNMRIAGLPFTALNNNAAMTWPLVAMSSTLAWTAGKALVAGVGANQAYATLYQQDPAGGAIALVPMDTAGSVFVSGFYEIAP